MIHLPAVNRKTWIAALVVAAVILLWLGFRYRANRLDAEPSWAEVKRENISQEIYEFGVIKQGEEIGLGFMAGGTIDDIKVKAGQTVSASQILASLDETALTIRLSQAKDNLALIQAERQKLLTGLTPAEIKIYEVTLDNAEQSVTAAEKSLADARRNLLNKIKDAYVKSDDAIRNNTDQFFLYPRETDATININVNDPSLKIDIGLGRINIETKLEQWKNEIDTLNGSSDLKGVSDEALDNLHYINEFLSKVALAVNDLPTYSTTPVLNVTSIRTYTTTARTNISSALSSLSTSIEAFNRAEAAFKTAQGSLTSAESQLNLASASPRSEDLSLYQSKVASAQAEVRLLEKQLADLIIEAPSQGIITEVKRRPGEVLSPGEPLIMFLADNPFNLEANIYEGEIANIEPGDEVEIELVAFSGQKFYGQVVSIDPVGRLIEGAVHFRVIVDVPNLPTGTRPEMTADIIIRAGHRDGALTLPEAALRRENGKAKVLLLVSRNQTEEREVVTGIRSNTGQVEIISGLKEGDKVKLW